MPLDTAQHPGQANQATRDQGRRALIHIGLPKTGTTTIQGFLAENAHLLAARGIHTQHPDTYPAWFRNAHAGPAIVALTRAGRLIPNLVLRKKLGVTTLQDQARFANEFETKFGAFVRDRPSGLFVISGEPMYNLLDKPDLIRTLDGFFAEYFPQRSYLVYLRDPVDWVASQYSQSISSGQDINLRTLIDQVARRDQFAQIAAWDDLLPECGMQVRLLEPDTLHGGGLLSDLCHVMGCNLDGLHVSRDRKLGLARHEIALLRYANRLGKNDLGWRLLRQTRRFRFSGRRGSFKLPRHHRDAVRAMFASSIERIRARYFPNRTSLFGDKSTPAHTLKDATP